MLRARCKYASIIRFTFTVPSQVCLFFSEKIIILSLFLLHFYLPGSGGQAPTLAFMQAATMYRNVHTAYLLWMGLSLSSATITWLTVIPPCNCACSPRVLFPTLCVVASQRTLLQSCAWKLRKEPAELKPLRYSSPNPEEIAPSKGTDWDLWFVELSRRLCCTSEDNTSL